MKKLNEYEWTYTIHGIGMAGFTGRVTWTARVNVSTVDTFKSEAAAIRDMKKQLKKVYGITKLERGTPFSLVQAYNGKP